MASESSRPTPLGVARARFVDGLPRKAAELRGSIALLAAVPTEEKPREELRRRLHALYASAQVFQIGPLSSALKDAIARLDRARDTKEGLTEDDVEALALLASTLPVLGQAEPSGPALGEPPPSQSEMAIPGPSTPEVEVPPAGKLPRVAPRASAPPGHRSTLPMNAPTPVVTHSPEPKQPLARPKDTLRGIPKSEPAPAEPEVRTSIETVISVLVVDAAEWQAKVRAMLAAERFEVLGASDPEEALRLARSSAPDVVLVDHATLLRPGVHLVRRLRDDPLTDFVPVVALVPTGTTIDPVAVRELGADDALSKPFDVADLESTLKRLAGLSARGSLAGLSGEHTIDEIASKIAEEVRRGLVETVDRGRDLKVPLGDGSEVLAAAWSAIGRVRAHLAHRSGGRVHFHDARAPGGPAFLALVDEDETPEPKHAPVSLRDRHVIVADDDPAVVWFFAGLLREEGAIVEEAADGAEALAHARRKRPDLVVSDILMPRLDGFALTRELKRDPSLADVPVILLSWKEDFLQRMRELQSGASGYLRKEAGAQQILEQVRDVLRPRARLEAQLRAGGDVRGRLERTGILPLIATVAQHRPSARITVRDAWNLFEIDLRPDEHGKARMVDLTRTASDGSFSRGPRVVVPLLGATIGRFAVVDADTAVRASIKEPLDAVLRKGAAQIGALVDAVSGKGLALAQKVELDEDVVASLLRSSPEPMTSIVEALRAGQGPRQMILGGIFAPDELEAVMLDLARQGAITAVAGADGEDRIAAASAARGEMALPVRTPSLVPPRPGATLEPPELAKLAPEPARPAADEEPGEGGLSWLESEESTADIVAEAHRLASQPPPATTAKRAADEPAPPGGAERPAPEPEPAAKAAEPEAVRAKEPPREAAPSAPRRDSTPSGERVASDPMPSAILDLDAPEHDPLPRRTPVPPASEPAAAKAARDTRDNEKRPAPASRSARDTGAAPDTRKAAAAAPAPAGGEGMGALGWAFLLVLLCVVGFVAVRTFLTPPSDPPPGAVAEPPAPEPAPEDGVARPDPAPVADPSLGAGTAETPPDTAAPSASLSGYGRLEPGVPPELGITPATGEGVVVLEPSRTGPVRVRIGDRERVVGDAPVALAMPEGVHEVAFVDGDDLAFRFVRVQAGATRYVPAP